MAKKEEIVADLKKLLETDTTRSKMGRIYEVYDEIVELQLAGVSIANIEASLNARGFDLKPGNLTSYLYQIRKKKSADWVPGMPDRRGQSKPKAPRAPKVKKPKGGGPATPGLTEGKGGGKDDGNIFQAVAEEMAAIEEGKDPRRNS